MGARGRVVGRAASPGVAGPFVDESDAPLVCQVERGGSIDPYPSSTRPAIPGGCGRATGTAAGSPSSCGRRRSRTTACRSRGRPWRSSSRHSANWWEGPEYAIGYALCESPAGPCERVGDGEWVVGTDTVWGPGGQAFVTDPAGDPWLAYDAWTGPVATYAEGGVRSLRVDRLRLDGGLLVLDGPTDGPR